MSITSSHKVPPQYHGVLRSVPSPRHVVVVGGGLAGAAAATVLAERGATCTVVEPLDYLGGRAGAWTDTLSDGTEFHQDRGFHAFFRQYYNLRNWLRRIDPSLGLLNELPDYPVIAPDGTTETFAYVPTDPILNFVGLINGSTTFKWRHLLRANIKVGLSMVAYQGEPTFAKWDQMTAKEYLDKVHLPRKARAMLFDVFAHSFFNPEEEMSAAEMIQYFHFYFMGNPEGLAFDMLDQPLSEGIWAPFETYLAARGVDFAMNTAVTSLEQRQDGSATGSSWLAHLAPTGDGGRSTSIEADAVVLAANVHGVKDIVAASPGLGTAAWRSDIAALEATSPYAVLRVWMDGDVGQDRAPFVSVADAGILDSVGLYHRLAEPEALWAAKTGGSVIEMHAYAVPKALEAHPDRVEAQLFEGLQGLYPEVRSLNEVDRRFHMMQDCPAFPVGQFDRRPRIETPVDSLVMAGDYCWVPIPCGLMERAVASGFLAANCLLSRWNVRGETLWSVPPRGIFASVLT